MRWLIFLHGFLQMRQVRTHNIPTSARCRGLLHTTRTPSIKNQDMRWVGMHTKKSYSLPLPRSNARSIPRSHVVCSCEQSPRGDPQTKVHHRWVICGFQSTTCVNRHGNDIVNWKKWHFSFDLHRAGLTRLVTAYSPSAWWEISFQWFERQNY